MRPINASMKEATAKHKEKHKQNYICKLGVKLPINRPWRPTSIEGALQLLIVVVIIITVMIMIMIMRMRIIL